MAVKADIENGKEIDIALRVTGIDEWEHDAIARKIHLEDVDGAAVDLTVFHNNDVADFEWEIGEWYLLENVVGNEFQGEMQLNPGYDLTVALLDDPPAAAENDELAEGNPAEDSAEQSKGSGTAAATSDASNTEAFVRGSEVDDNSRPTADGGGELLHQQPLSDGNYLLQFELGKLPELPVHEYELRATGSGGIDPDDFTNGIEGFSAKAANYYQSRIGSPVTTADASRRRIYATEKLNGTISIHGYTVKPVHQGETTLEARSYTDDGPLQEFVKQDVKRAVTGRFEVSGIDSIIEPTPQRTANSGLFEAYRKYKCRIRVDADGTVICGVNVAYHLESTFSAAEWVQRGQDIADVTVEHDTDLYDSARTATVQEIVDMDYDDVLDGPGVPMSEYHEKHVDQDVIDSMRAGDPIIADLQYGSGEDSIFPQLLEYCKVIPTFDQLGRVDDAFLDVIHNESRMKPEERFNVVTSFVDLLGPTPYFNFDPSPQPTNAGYREHKTRNIPNLRFGGGQTGYYGAGGLERKGYGVYKAPESFDIIALYPEDEEDDARPYVLSLLNKLAEYDASPTAFDRDTYELGSEFHYSQPAQKASDYDAALIVVPDEDEAAEADYDDPYPEFKRRLGQLGVPSQMISVDNLGNDNYGGNICSSLIGKAGGVPWRIDDVPGGVDAFVGLDVTYDHATKQHLGAAANVIMADGTILASEAVTKQAGETFDEDDVANVIKHVLEIFAEEEGRPPRHVVIHRDGKFYLDVESLINRLDKARDLIQRFDLVEIRKSGNPRIAEYDGSNSRFDIADKGVAFHVHNGDHSYLTTTGGKEGSPGTPRPLQIVKRHGSTDLDTLAEQTYWLSEAHVGSLSRSTRLPITTYYADKCADFAMKGYLTKGSVIRGVPYI
ncbi:Piwi domain-containing protein [Haloarchaeobius salinus]|uniref:Piwi domain-containing protein n=1 Tax=Haloarchaeobius salinus TaxID=1198298 RepID=UPI00210B9F0C|nr:Piwi domain-containing protein [Haloarchaeobius salinus]